MGLDISIGVVPNGKFLRDKAGEKFFYSLEHALSRHFCWLMCRKDVIEGEPELDQVGRITNIDISPLYEMDMWGGNDELDMRLDGLEDEDERKELEMEAMTSAAAIAGNLGKCCIR